PGVATLDDGAPPPAADPSLVPAAPTEPVYGRDASLTTPAAMHASDPPADPHAATTDIKPL
ncbi:MAG: hypothetical protein ABJC66_10530, partial [Gammaproteobacteria bacterium]